jgi:hypothetical protein
MWQFTRDDCAKFARPIDLIPESRQSRDDLLADADDEGQSV